MNIYLAGAITGIKNKNREQFAKWADRLRLKGHEVFNPSTLPDGLSANECIAHEVNHICLNGVEAIAFMPGWENSKGCRMEHALAVALDLKRMYLEEENEQNSLHLIVGDHFTSACA